jgi:hypothetical protein
MTLINQRPSGAFENFPIKPNKRMGSHPGYDGFPEFIKAKQYATIANAVYLASCPEAL